MDAVSAEVAEMEAKERQRWLTVAEGQKVRKAWDKLVEAMEKQIEKYDDNPEDATEALIFVVLSALTVDGFMRTAADAANQIKDLQPEKPA